MTTSHTTETRTTETAARPSRRLTRALSLASIPVALVVSGVVVSQASYSAYSASTTNPTTNWASGTVALADDDANAAAFTVTNLKPGMTGTKCIAVTSSGSLASSVKLYAADMSGTTDLANYMSVSVTQGTGGSFGSCTGFTPLATGASLYNGSFTGFGSSHTSYASGIGSWTPTGTADETRTFRVTYALDSAAPNSTQNGTAAGSFVWETQNS